MIVEIVVLLIEQWMGNMWKRVGWTKHARYAKRIQMERQDKWTSLEDMFMWLVLRRPNLATSSPDSSHLEQNNYIYSSYYDIAWTFLKNYQIWIFRFCIV